MKSLFESLGKALAATSYSVRVTVGIAVLAILAAAGYSGFKASSPHFEVLYGGLEANTASQMAAALAAANVRFQLSQPPGPHVLYVESGTRYLAENAIALSGASASAPTGIQTSAEGSSVFDGANERFQKSLKREWEEMEKQLILLDFVASARVTTSTPDRSPFRRDKAQTVAVTLNLRGSSELSKSQARTVAKLVRFRFDVPAENVVISDQHGNSLFDGSDFAGGGGDALENRMRFEKEMQAKANVILDKVLGPGAAYVVVNSEWSYEQSEVVRESYDPTKTIDVSKSSEKSTTPIASDTGAPSVLGGSSIGGLVGASSNLTGDVGNEEAIGGGGSGAPPAEATTKSERTQTVAGKETEHRMSHTPLLQRISVSLFLDKSFEDRKDDLMASVQAAVGFDDERDKYAAFVIPFASLERDEEGNLIKPEPVAPPEEPSQILGLVLEHGIEVIAALGFLFILMKALKSGSPAAAAGDDNGDDEELSEVEIERLAIAQVENLVKNDPERVAQILSAWALEDIEAMKVGS